MNRGLYISTMGMLANMAQLDNISNNLSNADTVGYKKDETMFKAYLEKEFRNYDSNDIKKGKHIGYMETALIADETKPILSQGQIVKTNNPLDFAIFGYGFFKIERNSQFFYSRNGEFKKDLNGFLVTSDGDYVLDSNNQRIQLPKDFTVDESGNIYNGTQFTGQKISIVNLNAPSKFGNNLFTGEEIASNNFKIIQGSIEKSNVNTLKEMINLINANRAFSIMEKSIQTQDLMTGKIIESAQRI
ncbi:flagellar basal-body rod protein FlgG [Marinitoga hydrogenitolerans DSM 16785]|uniref:Flagellar basal-body rod protein FlgG n=1 Tax=Marinitoga hydrogenitolerans (strain DSM 16785 / JCM 12826 / AT1271) TaxID=1122195 RepID=A0A1M4TGJ5_MARH1|nr:flagellar hook-basal body protein [Marinitoga hydrogenitolerans]SHE43427.1 flagellar basal-body rod protein FlgG [Marinitoga hydrogenitolerans DSM 16785]